jgi:transcriptional accessory protein Tex/SPT6
MESKMKADEEAIKVFASNLKELLLMPHHSDKKMYLL